MHKKNFRKQMRKFFGGQTVKFVRGIFNFLRGLLSRKKFVSGFSVFGFFIPNVVSIG